MANLRVSLFGKMCVRYEDRVVGGLDARKVQELMAYLLLHRDRVHLREPLADALWPESSAVQVKKNLRQTLWQLQAALVAVGGEHILLVEPASIGINTVANVWVDVAVFEQAYDRVRGVRGNDLGAVQIQALHEAVVLYQSDLLEGWYQDWCLYERERLQNMYLEMLDKLMISCECRGEYEPGLDYGGRVLRLDRARERTHRRMMRLYYFMGDRAAALRQYDTCAAALQDELNVKPAKSTVALYEQIRADHIEQTELAFPEPAKPLTPSDPSETGATLAQVREVLSATRHHMQQVIEVIDTLLSGK